MSLAYREDDGHVSVYTAAGLYDVVRVRGVKAGGRCVMCGSPVALRLFTKPRRGVSVTSDFQHLKRYPCRDQVACDVHDRALDIVRAAILKGLVINLSNGGVFAPKDVLADKAIGEVRPDLILIDERGDRLLVEIRVTHPVTPAKEMFLRSLGYPAFEIDMSGTYRRKVSDTDIEASIFGNAFRRRWIVRPGEPKVQLDIKTAVPTADPGFLKVQQQAAEFEALMKARFGYGFKSMELVPVVASAPADDRQIEMKGMDAGARVPRGGMENPRAFALRKSGGSNGGVVPRLGPGIFDAVTGPLPFASKPASIQRIEMERLLSA